MEEVKESNPINEKSKKDFGLSTAKKNLTDKFRENPWMLSTLVLGLAVLTLLYFNVSSGGLTGFAVSGNNVAGNLVAYLNENAPSEVVLKDVSTESGLYKIDVEFQGETIPVYATKDGKYMASLQPIVSSTDTSNAEAQPAADIKKSDKPIVELYVFTYCPYGLQMEKAILPAVNLLGNKINFKIRQIGAMHGNFEKVEAERQLCIEKNYPGKFLNYISTFAADTSVGSCNGDATCLAPKLNAIYTKLGIDGKKIDSCIASEGEKLYNAEVANANSKSVSGSPTLIINGVKADSGRSPDAVKTTICSAFNTAPAECKQTLSTSSSSAGFGAGASSGSASASC
ncbi:MAG: hypothetical protein KKA64_04135 [Nanoarchaeota archaeon]|nr:hypothetical protein [Nanoarchaeota archaeon]